MERMHLVCVERRANPAAHSLLMNAAMNEHEIDELWDQESTIPNRRYASIEIASLPEPVRRYVSHAIAPGAVIASAVLLEIHGEINLQNEWREFVADQVIRWDSQFKWTARSKPRVMPHQDGPHWLDQECAKRWKLLGVHPLESADGVDIHRLARGRVQLESIWMPTVFLAPVVEWRAFDPAHVGVEFAIADHAAHLDLSIDQDGRLKDAHISRWGNPDWFRRDKTEFHDYPFGAVISEETTFDGITIPTKLCLGWHFGTPRFEGEGEFLRVTVDKATFR